MSNPECTKALEALCEAAVFADLSDLRTVSSLLDGFENLDVACSKSKKESAAALCRQCIQRLHAIILDDVKDRVGALKDVCATASQLQHHLRDGEPLHELVQEAPAAPAAPAAPEAPAEPVSESKASASSAQWTQPSNVDQAFVNEFLSVQPAVLDEAEAIVLKLSEPQERTAAIASLRGLLHNLKGESSILAMRAIEQLCHATEELLVEPLPAATPDVLLRVIDAMRSALAYYGGKSEEPAGLSALHAELARLKPKSASDEQANTHQSPAPAEVSAPAEVPAAEVAPVTVGTPEQGTPLTGDLELIQGFIPESKEHLENAVASLLALGTDATNKEHLDALFRAFHTIKGCAGFLMLDKIQALAHQSESLLDKARNGTVILSGLALEATFEATDLLKEMIDGVEIGLKTGLVPPPSAAMPELVDRLRALAAGQTPTLKQKTVPAAAPAAPAAPAATVPVVPVAVAVAQPVNSALPASDNAVSAQSLPAVVAAPEAAAPQAAQPRLTLLKIRDAVKVDADRLDRLIDTIGELVISESMVSQSSDLRKHATAPLIRQLGQLDKITRELQEMAMSLRMMPVRTTFQKMGRLIHDVAKRTGKQCELILSGEETELDKAVVDGIGDPLVHMIRNAVDHGLEANAEERIKAGKPAKGRVDLRAYHKGGSIFIEVQDDGRGLDRDAILRKAAERGLIRDGEQLSEREIFNLIFLPGFSTAKTVTDVSGRGVGMDVVRKNIEALRGQVDISSQPGQGTKFTIRLPLTLAIIDGMVVNVGQERYIVPTLSIVMSLRPQPGAVKSVLNRGEMLSYQGELIPLFRIDRTFSIKGAVARPEDGLVIIVEEDGKRTGLLADGLLGQQQIVIKTLGDSMRGIPGVSGGAIMPDGNVGLILDVGALVRISQNSQQAQGAAATSNERVA